MDNSVPRTLGKIKHLKAPNTQKFTVLGEVRWGQEIHTYINAQKVFMQWSETPKGDVES